MEYTVSIKFESVNADNPLAVAKEIAKWLKESADEMVYDVTNEETKETVSVDLSEEDEDAVLPNDKPNIHKISKALQTLSNDWCDNWDIIVDTFGEDLARLLDEATIESRKF